MCRTKMCLPLTGRLSLDRSGPETAGDAVREPYRPTVRETLWRTTICEEHTSDVSAVERAARELARRAGP